MNGETFLIYVTVPDRQTGMALARSMVGQRLAACANLLGGSESVYWWQGQLNSEAEVVLVFKTAADRLETLTQALCQEHPYDCPCVAAVPIVGGNPDFIAWIEAETRPEAKP